MQIKTINQGSKKNHFSLFGYSRLKILKMVARCKILLGKKEGKFCAILNSLLYLWSYISLVIGVSSVAGIRNVWRSTRHHMAKYSYKNWEKS